MTGAGPLPLPGVPPLGRPPPPEVPSPPPGRAGRLRLLALVGLVALWLAPWAEVQGPDGGIAVESWTRRTGAPAVLALVALWGLSATALVARTRRGLRIGAAWTDAAVALATTALLFHDWIPGGEMREAWVPIFGPLALLAALDAVVRVVRPDAGPEVAWLRAGAGLFAAASLAVNLAWIPAGAALWVGVSALVSVNVRTASAARRAGECFALAASAVALLAPRLHEALGDGAPIVEEMVATRYGWTLLALLVGVIAGVLLLRTPSPAAAPAAA